MGNCIDVPVQHGDVDEVKLILRQNPFLRKLPYIPTVANLQHVGAGLSGMPGEFCWSRELSASFVAELCYRGFVPMAELVHGGRCVLLPKLHAHRCVLHFSDMHVPQKVRKRSAGYELTVDTCFDEVVRGCQAQHGEGCWLHDELVAIFRALHTPAPKKYHRASGANSADAASASMNAADGGAAAGAGDRDDEGGSVGMSSSSSQGSTTDVSPPSSARSTASVASTSSSVSTGSSAAAAAARPLVYKARSSSDSAAGVPRRSRVMSAPATPSATAQVAWRGAKAAAAAARVAAVTSGRRRTQPPLPPPPTPTQPPHRSASRTAIGLASREKQAQAAGANVPASSSSSSTTHATHSPSAAASSTLPFPRDVRFHSFELWADGVLVAGELGYSIGACYTSLSGFYTRKSAGTVQCVAAAKVRSVERDQLSPTLSDFLTLGGL